MKNMNVTICKLIDEAVRKAGSQGNLAKKLDIKYQNRFGDYKAGRRVPDDLLIGQLAQYLGYDPIEMIMLCKAETDKEKATLWLEWLNKWHPIGDSNPCYRRERAMS